MDNNRIRQQSAECHLSWLPQVYAFGEAGRTADAMDMLFDRVDDLLLEGQVAEVDDLLNAIDLKRLNTTLRLAVLVITKPASSALKSRASLLRRVEADLRESDPERVERLLSGLR